METQSARTDLPSRELLAVYRPSLNKLLAISLFALSTLYLLISIGKPPFSWIFIILPLMSWVYFALDYIRSKVEYYVDAVVIYSAFQHQVFHAEDIEDLFWHETRSGSFGLARAVASDYRLQRCDGATMSFSTNFQSCTKLVTLIQSFIRDENGALSRAFDKLDHGKKMRFSQFTVTSEGITAENGEFRAWADIEVIRDVFTAKWLIAERNKRTMIGGQSIWVELPARHSYVFEGLLDHYITKNKPLPATASQ